MKFNIGDRVVVVKDETTGFVGTLGTVKHIFQTSDSAIYRVQLDNGPITALPFDEDELAPAIQRVMVVSGDQSQILGPGTLVGHVDVYALDTNDGWLMSEEDATRCTDLLQKQAEYANCPIIRLPDNPKIVLDTGQIVYGCQVWWSELEE